MENKSLGKELLPVIVLFVIIMAGVFIGKQWLLQAGIDPIVVIWGNILLFGVSVFSFIQNRKALLHANTQGFLRHVYSGLLLKLLVCIAAAFAYIFTASDHISKGALFVCMGLYLIYTFLEMRNVLNISKQQKKNG